MEHLGEQESTGRGFPVVHFRDIYDAPCSLQSSSLATAPAIWLGTDDAMPKVLASEAAKFGVSTTETTGWVPYPVPDGVLLTTRMHLDAAQVEALIKHLQCWLATGQFTQRR